MAFRAELVDRTGGSSLEAINSMLIVYRVWLAVGAGARRTPSAIESLKLLR